jgi:cell division protein FtsI (penicillin-binding protein 3)
MGARDAVFLLESAGIKVKISGKGKVKRQSLAPGSRITAGSQCVIELG